MQQANLLPLSENHEYKGESAGSRNCFCRLRSVRQNSIEAINRDLWIVTKFQENFKIFNQEIWKVDVWYLRL